MTRKFVLTGVAVAVLVNLTSIALAGADDYVFESSWRARDMSSRPLS
jgi:hypothetical protein